MMTEKNEFRKRPLPALAMQSIALVAALFSVVIAILLIADHVRLIRMDPLNDPVLLELREQLADTTDGDTALVEQIRTYDLYARRAFFSNAEERRIGGLMLLGGLAVFMIASKLNRLWTPKLPSVGRHDSADHTELNTLFRQLMAGTGIFLTAMALFFAFAVKSDLSVVLSRSVPPGSVAAVEDGSVETAGLPSAFSENWPSLRGAGNVGVSGMDSAPVSWDTESGEGILWKVPVPVHGFNSPIVWGRRVMMSGADDQGQEVLCFDADSGDLLWSHTVETAVDFPDVTEDTGYAAPTMATDGTRVFVIFATGELAAYDLEGHPVWQKNIGVPENPYGMGSSLISDGIRLFVQYDHMDEQKVMAFDGATGEQVWEKTRAHISWSSPSLIETGYGLQLVLNDESHVTAYDPVSGKELWTVECLGGEVAPSPAFNGGDLVFVGNEYAQATALRLTDTTPEIIWQYDEYLPEISSPLAAPERFYIATSAGDIVCLEAASGETLWAQEFDDGFSSSPILVGGHVYAVDLGGVVHVFDDAGVYHSVADVAMGEPVYATPAFANGHIYIRGDENLYCVGTE